MELVGPNPFLGVIYHWIGGFAPPPTSFPFGRSSAGRGRCTGSSRASPRGSSRRSCWRASLFRTCGRSSRKPSSEYPRSLSMRFLFGVCGASAESPSASPSATSASRWDTRSRSACARSSGRWFRRLCIGSAAEPPRDRDPPDLRQDDSAGRVRLPDRRRGQRAAGYSKEKRLRRKRRLRRASATKLLKGMRLRCSPAS